MKVADMYSKGTVHIPMSCTVQEAAKQMRDQHVGALAVTEGGESGRAIGVVTDRDIVLKTVAQGVAPADILVGEVVTPGMLTVDAQADSVDAVQTMLSHGVRRLAVTCGEDRVVGVLSLDDLMEAYGRDMAMLSSLLANARNRERTGSVQSALHM
ncbi:CBS domain-containing protein [Caballeronia sp. AZ1_KS37]|uniref:CBS domain-containing protein n=1 Tax=Caballeronia sp. AZ1_KS37 TaxID=2921756 RepID=UPI0020278508|nr:CBS domain-containing protein [Caballeronia sp. AZ1_KS37]